MMAGRVGAHMTISLDGFGAGPNQTLETPLGENGGRLHRWMFEDADNNAHERQIITAYSAFIMGRNMFGPDRKAWDGDWKGWWGDDPPYHAPVFVLTHYPRPPLTMLGGTTFTFVTDGVASALAQAREAAAGGDVGIAGGADTVRQYLAAGLIDVLRLHVAPVILGAGERLLEGVGELTLEPMEVSGTRLATHLGYRIVH